MGGMGAWVLTGRGMGEERERGGQAGGEGGRYEPPSSQLTPDERQCLAWFWGHYATSTTPRALRHVHVERVGGCCCNYVDLWVPR
jgi:hypothetical protein